MASRIIPPLVTIGQRFGRWIVVNQADPKIFPCGRITPRWEVLCDCGTQSIILQTDLRSGHSQSCGCLRKNVLSVIKKTHGQIKTPLYRCWAGILQRCYNKKSAYFYSYGERGIEVYKEWRDSFEAFARDVGQRPSPNHSLDRYPNKNGNYEPGNVRWATREEQVSNRRNSIIVEWQGKEMTLAKAAKLSGINYLTAWNRLQKFGWSVEKTFGTPMKLKPPSSS